MIKIDIYNLEGKVIDNISLNDQIFGLDENDILVHQVYVAQAANRRLGSSHTKTRGERRGGGRKPWKQKGTGNARTGTIRNPIWRGGGIIFGPRKNQNFSKNINSKMKKKALLIALSGKLKNEKIKIIDSLKLAENKTKF
jgi:large subunit ribosomal protein L4